MSQAELRDQLPPPPQTPTPNEILAKGRVQLNGIAQVNVPLPAVTADSLIFTSYVIVSGTLGLIGITINPGVGFSLSSVALNSSTVAWQLLAP